MRYGTSALAAAVVAVTGLATAAQAQEATLRAASAFALGTTFSRPFEDFVDRVNAAGEGVLRIELVGGPEAVPAFELGNAVASGVVDLGNATAAFYTNILPVGDALKLARGTIAEQRADGCYEIVDAMHQAVGLKYLGRTGDGIGFHLYTTSPVEGTDLTGLSIRTTPVYQAFFAALGATPVTTAPGEVYTALERGTIDGYGWPIQGVLDLGWDEQTRYRVDPGFYQVDVNFLVNLDAWEGLTDAQRALLEAETAAVEAEQSAANAAANEAEAAAQAEAGIEVIALSEADAARWLATADEAGWAAAIAADGQAERLRDCFAAD